RKQSVWLQPAFFPITLSSRLVQVFVTRTGEFVVDILHSTVQYNTSTYHRYISQIVQFSVNSTATATTIQGIAAGCAAAGQPGGKKRQAMPSYSAKFNLPSHFIGRTHLAVGLPGLVTGFVASHDVHR